MYSGFTYITLIIDSNNIGFNILIIILFPIINWIAEFETKSNNYIIIFILLFFLLLLCFLLNSLILFFICYECLIVLLFFILFIFIPSFYRIRTAFFFFLFSILGSINYINIECSIVIHHYRLSWFITTIVILISSIVIFNSINYLSLIESYSFIFYITLP